MRSTIDALMPRVAKITISFSFSFKSSKEFPAYC
jgi:hypothetical protein